MSCLKHRAMFRLLQIKSGPRLALANFQRAYHQLTPDEICNVSLKTPLPGFPKIIYAQPKHGSDAETKVTIMSNGLRVASEKKFGQYCIAGVAINSGSRYEVAYPAGVSHFIERLAFKSTQIYKDREHILEELSKCGGTLDCQGSRDTLIYAVSVDNKYLEHAVELLGETVLRPNLTNEEVMDTSHRLDYELQDMALDPERKMQLCEMIHAAAYRQNTLGLPKICPKENLDKINRDMLFTYMKNNHTPERMVLAGVGVEHERLVEFAQKHFVDKPARWVSEPKLVLPYPSSVDKSIAQYTGGMNAIEADLSNVSLGPTSMPNLAHFQLGFEVCSHLELDEFVVVCVMNMLMGGGGSFSAGGPGKGMFTRLFTNVLNRHHWIQNSAAHNFSYDDTGIFYIHSSSDPSQLKDLVDIIVSETLDIAHGKMEQEELARAKKQLISMLWLNLEVRPVVFEDIARQVLASGFRNQPKHLISKIEKVTEEDIRRVAHKMLMKTPSVACLGDLKQMPSLDYIVSRFNVVTSHCCRL